MLIFSYSPVSNKFDCIFNVQSYHFLIRKYYFKLLQQFGEKKQSSK
jgi:hypothetical protein